MVNEIKFFQSEVLAQDKIIDEELCRLSYNVLDYFDIFLDSGYDYQMLSGGISKVYLTNHETDLSMRSSNIKIRAGDDYLSVGPTDILLSYALNGNMQLYYSNAIKIPKNEFETCFSFFSQVLNKSAKNNGLKLKVDFENMLENIVFRLSLFGDFNENYFDIICKFVSCMDYTLASAYEIGHFFHNNFSH